MAAPQIRMAPGQHQHPPPQQMAVPGQRFIAAPPGYAPQPPIRRPLPPGVMPPNPQQMRAVPPRKKKKFGDKVLNQQIHALVPESKLYHELLQYEQKLDATISRKKLEIQESLKRPHKLKKKLRIFVTNNYTPGKEPENENDDPTVPMWELRVEGRLIDDSAPTAQPAQPNQQPTPQRPPIRKKFSTFFKSLVIELDKDLYGPDNHLVEWHRTPSTHETDGFQRPGDRPVKCTILLLLDFQPMRFKLHPRLSKLLGISFETRPKIVEALWQYIKAHSLQDIVDRDTINNDPQLEHVFNCKKMRFMEIPQRLHALLQQPDPIILEHLIDPSTALNGLTSCFDIDVEIDDPLKLQMHCFMQPQPTQHELAALDLKIHDTISEYKTRYDFFMNFAKDPQEFIRKWLVSQAEDLKHFSEGGGESEKERHAEYYFNPEVQEGVFRYIYSKVQQRRAEIEQSLGIRHN